MSEHEASHNLATRSYCVKGRKARARSMDLDTRLPHKFTGREHGRVQVYSQLYTSAESMSFAREHAHDPAELEELHNMQESMKNRIYTQDMLDALR